MRPAKHPPDERDGVRLLVVDPHSGRLDDRQFADLPSHLHGGDLLVFNDVATLPASLSGVDEYGRPLEVRLVALVLRP